MWPGDLWFETLPRTATSLACGAVDSAYDTKCHGRRRPLPTERFQNARRRQRCPVACDNNYQRILQYEEGGFQCNLISLCKSPAQATQQHYRRHKSPCRIRQISASSVSVFECLRRILHNELSRARLASDDGFSISTTPWHVWHVRSPERWNISNLWIRRPQTSHETLHTTRLRVRFEMPPTNTRAETLETYPSSSRRAADMVIEYCWKQRAPDKQAVLFYGAEVLERPGSLKRSHSMFECAHIDQAPPQHNQQNSVHPDRVKHLIDDSFTAKQ